LGKLPLPPVFELTCKDNVYDNKAFTGDVGSIFVAKCPRGCKQSPGIIQGTSIYRDDGSICLSAIHSGVITNEDGGYVLISKKPPLKEYYGFTQRELNSLFASASTTFSFSVSKVPSTAFGMVKLFSDHVDGKFPNLGPKGLALPPSPSGTADPNPDIEA